MDASLAVCVCVFVVVYLFRGPLSVVLVSVAAVRPQKWNAELSSEKLKRDLDIIILVPDVNNNNNNSSKQKKKKKSKLINPAVKTEDITIIPKAVNKTGFKLVDVLRVT